MYINVIWFVSVDLGFWFLAKNKYDLANWLVFLISATLRLSQLFAAKNIVNLPQPPIWTTRFIICETCVSFGQLYLTLDSFYLIKHQNRFNYYKRLLAAAASSLALDPLWYRSGTISQYQSFVLVTGFTIFTLLVAR